MRYAWTVESVRRVQRSGETASKIRLGKGARLRMEGMACCDVGSLRHSYQPTAETEILH